MKGRKHGSSHSNLSYGPLPPSLPLPLPPFPEGTPTSELARLQFRFPDGQRTRRNFFKFEKVKGLYSYL
jgi:hypothetical protein